MLRINKKIRKMDKGTRLITKYNKNALKLYISNTDEKNLIYEVRKK